MRQTIAITLTVLLVGLGAPAMAHDGPYDVHHACEGDTDWVANTLGAQLNGVYIQLYLHNNEEDAGDPEGSPGILWMESNGWTQDSTEGSPNGKVASDLQKENFVCKSEEHDDPSAYIAHSDTVIL